MKHTITHSTDTARQMTIELNANDLAPIKQKTLVRLAKKVKVAGFRPGKAPVSIAEKNLDPNMANAEVLQDAVNAALINVLDAAKITPLDRPQVDVKKFVPGQELTFNATFEVIPDIKLGDYKKLKAEKPPVKVTSKDVTQVIERMRQGMAEKKAVSRPAENGDEVIIDFTGADKHGKPVAGAAGKDYPLTLGSSNFIPGFEEGLLGKKVGDNVTLPLTFPKDYHHAPLAGALVHFAVTVKEVKQVTLPPLDDAFAAKAGPFKTVAELKADVTRELTDQKEREAIDKLKDNLVEQLVKVSHVPAPEVLVQDQMASIERDFTQNLLYRGQTLDQYLQQQGLTQEAWRNKELRDQAVRRVQVGLALAELSKAEDIQASREELEARMQELLNYYKEPHMRQQIDTPEARRDVANRVLTEKTVNHLVQLNQKTP